MTDFEPNVGAELPRRRFLVTAILSLTAVAMVSGCQSTQRLEVSQSGAPKFERFRAEYRFQQADQLLSDRSGPTTFVHKDVRELTVSRTDVELLISELANQGYFDATPDESGTAQLAVQIDRGRTDRAWINDARLLDLARQTLTAGTSPTH
jgi:hypothetical protein